MHKEYTSIFHEETIVQEARNTFEQLNRSNRILSDKSREKSVNKHIDKATSSLSKKEQIKVNQAAKRDREGRGTGKDMDTLARVSNAADASMRHERRHGAKHESGLLGIDII